MRERERGKEGDRERGNRIDCRGLNQTVRIEWIKAGTLNLGMRRRNKQAQGHRRIEHIHVHVRMKTTRNAVQDGRGCVGGWGRRREGGLITTRT